MKNYLLYNPFAGGGKGEAQAKTVAERLEGEVILTDITKITDYKVFMESCKGERVTLCGGDGTLNRFINEIDGIDRDCELYFTAAGTGNDFLKEVADGEPDAVIDLKKYIENLPVCRVGDKKSRFINGVGYGIDGYCCEVGDRLRAAGKTKVNYTAIAIKGLLFHYKPTGATVTVDGVEHRFEKVWLAPVMKGKHYGGGMIPAPGQDRFDKDGKLSVFVFHGSGKLKTLMIFPKIFSGEHVRHTDVTKVLTGNEITVEFDSPRALQIDGETVLDVKRFTASSAKEKVTL